MNLFVTALFDLYPHIQSTHIIKGQWTTGHLTAGFRIECLKLLMESGVEIAVYASPDIVKEIGEVPGNVRLIPTDLCDVPTFKRLASIQSRPALPTTRNEVKDTYEYLALMNSKFDFVADAEKRFPFFNHYSWIDAGVFKLCNDHDEAREHLRAISNVKGGKIITPRGRQEMLSDEPFPPTHPCWRFLGSLLIIPQELVAPFVKEFMRELDNVLADGVITWEVNVLAYLERRTPNWFTGYAADHNQEILRLPDEFR